MNQKVTFNKGFGIALIIASVFILSVSFLIGISLNTLTGAILLVLGICYLNNPALEYDKDELRIKNLYGGTVKKYSFHIDKIEVREGAMYANDNKIRVAGSFLNKTELTQLHEYITHKDYLN